MDDCWIDDENANRSPGLYSKAVGSNGGVVGFSTRLNAPVITAESAALAILEE